MKELTKLLTDKYGSNFRLEPYCSGKDKDIYLFSLPHRQFVVLINKRNTSFRGYRFLLSNELQKNLFLKRLKTPDVVDFFELSDGRTIAVHSFIDGVHIDGLSFETAYKTGEIIAEMHIFANCENSYKFLSPKRYAVCRIIRNINEFLRRIKIFLIDYPAFKLPYGICHRDLNFNNLIFKSEEPYLIDFDRQRKIPYVYEILRFFKGKTNKRYFEAFMAGYSSKRFLNKDEQNFLSANMHKDLSS